MQCKECAVARARRWFDGKGTAYHTMATWVSKCEAAYTLGGACTTCGETDVSVLQFDHIAGDGYLERKKNSSGGSGKSVSSWIKTHPEEARAKYQVLCANCHMRKTVKEHRERGWPHGKARRVAA
jgi:5-methylcytosine-specific restriction endonuclease McrA